MSRFQKYALWVFSILILICLAAEVQLRVVGNTFYYPPFKGTLLENDSTLGWKNKMGRYTLKSLLYDSTKDFTVFIGKDGNRISSDQDDTKIDSSTVRPEIHFYGCSYVYGQSVRDTATFCYKLQKQVKKYRIVNRGVPAYGLTQMYLSLRQSLLMGDTPYIAVFNYAGFHDCRTPLHKQWTGMFSWALNQNYVSEHKEFNYPYLVYDSGVLKLGVSHLDQLTKNWPGVESSALLHFMQMTYFSAQGNNLDSYLHLVSTRTAIYLMQYCTANNIVPVFATIDDSGNDIVDSLSKLGYYTLKYGINIDDVKYNCTPVDPGHPNGLAHSIYADTLYRFFARNKIGQNADGQIIRHVRPNTSCYTIKYMDSAETARVLQRIPRRGSGIFGF